MMSTEIIDLQKDSRVFFIYFAAALLFLHGTGFGGCLVYGGLTFYDHRHNHTLQEDHEKRTFLYLNEEEGSSYLSVVPIMELVGTIFAHPASEYLGRKPTLVLTNFVQIFGFGIIYFSSSVSVLMFGRSLTCFALGLGAMTPLVLLSEMATIKQRAPLSIIGNLSISFGILASFFFVYLFPTKYLIFFIVGESLIFLLFSVFLPESPHYLIRKCKTNEAEQVFKKLRGPHYKGIELEIKEIKEVIDKEFSSVSTESHIR